MSKLILLRRSSPLEFEIHKGEINQTKNLILTTTDEQLATDIVDRYNAFVIFQYNNQDNLIERAKNYAIDCHQSVNHFYDNKSYSVHLEMVYEYGKKYSYLLPEEDVEIVLAACWAHDIIEDTRRTYNDVKIALNPQVADIVYALSNEKGKNRAERANTKYYDGINNTPYATFCKICDRLANVKYSKESGSKMIDVYRKENESFRSHFEWAWMYGDYKPMFDELQVLFI